MPIPIKARVQTTPKSFEVPPAIVLIGREGKSTPRGSWFGKEELEQAKKAAALSGLQVVSVRSNAVRELVHRIPRGRIFSSGKAFAPKIQPAVFDALVPHAKPVGSAKVIRMTAKPGAGGGEADKMQPAVEAPAEETPVQEKLPPDWARITVGHTVLAYSPEDESWFEAIVTKAKGDGLFVLRWRDYPDEDEFQRRRDKLALKFPADQEKAA